MIATKNLAEVIKKRSINVAAMCSQTGLSAKIIYASLGKNSTRELRADELLTICKYIDIDPFELFKRDDVEKAG